MNLLDRAISYLAPVAGARRVAARNALASAKMVYDAAGRSPRTAFRKAGGTSANTEIQMSLPRLRDVSRDLGRNNPYAANIHTAIPANVVGAGIIPQVVSTNKKLKASVQTLIKNHLDTPAIDFDGRGNFAALQNLAMRAVVESGDALIVRYLPPPELRLAVPLQIRVLEGDYLDHLRNGPQANGNVCFHGIECDRWGRRVAYWLFDEHPGGGLTWKFPRSTRYDAANIFHIYRQDRPGQMRGIPWGAAGIMTMWDLGDYEEAELMRQKIAACFAVFFTGTEPGGLAAGVGTTTSQAGNPVEVLEPGLIQRLPSGSTVTTATPPMMTGYMDFTRGNARKICMAYGVPYEIGTGDLSQVSFISGRMGWIKFDISVDQWRWHMLIPHMCAGVMRWFLEAAAIPLGQPLQSKVSCDWTPPRRQMVSPKDEIPAMQAASRAGLTTRSENVRSLGFDPETVEAEFAEENTRADALGLRFESDGRWPLATRGTEAITPPADAGAGDGAPSNDNPPATPPGKGNQ